MLSIRKLQKCANEPKLHQGKTCIKPQKRRVKKKSTVGEQCCEISQPAKFAGCEFSQPCKIFTEHSFSSAFFLQISLVRSCIFEFGSGLSCLNRIEDNEEFALEIYNNSAIKRD